MAEPEIQPGCHSCSKALFCHYRHHCYPLRNSRTNELHTVKESRYWIRKLDREYLERRVDASFTNRQAHKIFRRTRKSPPHIVQALKTPMQVSHPLDGNIYALIEPDQDDSATVKYSK